ncbi:MAG: hypothetical protein IJO52_03740 [Clostridia bacterium]|nr:hypothetical protein [Clostridia bacterium]
MKKLIIISMLLSFIFLFSCTNEESTIGIIGGADGPTSVIVSTGGDKEGTSFIDFFVDKALEHTVSMGEFAADPEVRSLYSSSEKLDNEVAAMGEGDYSVPASVYTVKISKDGIVNYMAGQGGVAKEAIDKLFYANRIRMTTLVSTYNATFGANKLAAASVTSQQEGYVMPEFEGNFGILLEYNGAFSSFTAYEKIGEGVIESTTNFVYNGEDEIGADGFIKAITESVGEENIVIEKVK